MISFSIANRDFYNTWKKNYKKIMKMHFKATLFPKACNSCSRPINHLLLIPTTITTKNANVSTKNVSSFTSGFPLMNSILPHTLLLSTTSNYYMASRNEMGERLGSWNGRHLQLHQEPLDWCQWHVFVRCFASLISVCSRI